MSRPLLPAPGPISGTMIVPGDKSISHRAALFGLIAAGPCRATGWLDAADTRRSLEAAVSLGCAVELAAGVLQVTPGKGPPVAEAGHQPVTLDCGNSGTTARLIMGLLAGWLPRTGPQAVLRGDASLSGRPMGRVIDPLRAMGADIACLETAGRLPVLVSGTLLRGVRHTLPVPSAQVKSALLLAGLFAEGATEIHGGGASRDHTERLLNVMGVGPKYLAGDGLRITGGRKPGAFDIAVPGDPSSAAFFLVAAAMIPGSRLTIENHALNEGRIGALKILRRAGAAVTIGRPRGPRDGEMTGEVTVEAAELRPFTIGPEEIPSLVDEIPALAVLATAIPGVSTITGAAELRVKESDRLGMMARNLSRLGAVVEEFPAGLRITGGTRLKGGDPAAPLILETAGDHRIAMALAIAALTAAGECALDDGDCVTVSYPDFFNALASLWSRA